LERRTVCCNQAVTQRDDKGSTVYRRAGAGSAEPVSALGKGETGKNTTKPEGAPFEAGKQSTRGELLIMLCQAKGTRLPSVQMRQPACGRSPSLPLIHRGKRRWVFRSGWKKAKEDRRKNGSKGVVHGITWQTRPSAARGERGNRVRQKKAIYKKQKKDEERLGGGLRKNGNVRALRGDLVYRLPVGNLCAPPGEKRGGGKGKTALQEGEGGRGTTQSERGLLSS